jgi:hypothetical protein
MAGDSIGAAKAKMFGNFLCRGHDALRLLETLQKIEDLLLFASDGLHTV